MPDDSHRNFNPRSPWGERPIHPPPAAWRNDFNPRSPWGERRHNQKHPERGFRFQSTLPVGGATLCWYLTTAGYVFQSTLPVGGATRLPLWPESPACHFNPRSPWGERQPGRCQIAIRQAISIHAPRGGSDKIAYTVPGAPSAFQSTLPVGGATAPSAILSPPRVDFNPRSPWGERRWYVKPRQTEKIFQSTLPVGGATGFLFLLCVLL